MNKNSLKRRLDENRKKKIIQFRTVIAEPQGRPVRVPPLVAGRGHLGADVVQVRLGECFFLSKESIVNKNNLTLHSRVNSRFEF